MATEEDSCPHGDVDRSAAMTDDVTTSSRVERILDTHREALQDGRLPMTVYNDEEIFETELHRIFGQCWMFIGHETEVPEPGDYAKRYIGKDPFIFIRGEDGQIRVLFDSCTHHGSQLCKAEQGNSSHFRCPYHGWTFKNTGDLAGIPLRDQAFEGLDPDEWGLHEAPRVENYKGLVFASIADEGPSLEEYLGDFKWYLDVHLDIAKGGMEVIGEPHRWRADSDWKSGSDNFSADSYHTGVAHRSVFEVGFGDEDISGTAGQETQRHVTHADSGSTSLRLLDPEEEIFFGYPEEYITDENLSDEQYEVAAACGAATGTIFPNLSFIHLAATNDPDKPLDGFFSLRQWQPVAPGEMEAWSWVLVPAEASEEYKQRAYDVALGTFSPSGNFEQDDFAVWDGIAEAAGTVFADQQDVQMNYQMGMPGIGKAEIDEDWDGPGTAWDDNLEEGTCRTFHGNWQKAMNGEEVGMRYPRDHI
ncbi:Rieske 2Fe-2S domain-containing protein [Natrialba sp. INN-245]|uniref:aromatic ring-hydroxylating oxygenase subunit alpha n=1 Tax=Natrialba sp. INN-245 TaxID=2690967 RepID=UPI001310DE50|nr:Rieske 2Fe-2S domain-containing protein [Natrialba sp. INN-245]MWV38454.1 Rieske 2Fe-2S domain-containing protein [Natrialba sp. INN-245]